MELAEVTGFDLDQRIVHASILGLKAIEIPYDSLIVAAGVNQSYFGHDDFALFAPGMKTIDDAFELRRRFFGAFEMAEMVEDPTEKERWLTVAIVGAGPTGVELAGQVRELAVRSLRGEFRTFEPSSVRVVLLTGGSNRWPPSARSCLPKRPRSWSASGCNVDGRPGGGSRRLRRGYRRRRRGDTAPGGSHHGVGCGGRSVPPGHGAGQGLWRRTGPSRAHRRVT